MTEGYKRKQRWDVTYTDSKSKRPRENSDYEYTGNETYVDLDTQSKRIITRSQKKANVTSNVSNDDFNK